MKILLKIGRVLLDHTIDTSYNIDALWYVYPKI